MTDHVTDQLPLWAEGDLAATEMAAVDRHLADCPGCRNAAEHLKTSQAWLREALAPPFNAGDRDALRRQVMERIRAEPQARTASRFNARPALLAACAASFLVAVLVWRTNHRRLAPPAVLEPPPKVARNSAPSDPQPLRVHRDAPRVVQLRQRPHIQRTESPPQDGPARIEFQTADPTIHIIWLAQAAPLAAANSPTSEAP